MTVLDPVTGQEVAHYPLDVPGSCLGVAVDTAGNMFVNLAVPPDRYDYTALVELDPAGTTIGTWSTAGETVAVAPDDSAIYLAGSLGRICAPTPFRSRDPSG